MAEIHPVDPEDPVEPTAGDDSGGAAAAELVLADGSGLAFVCPTCSQTIVLTGMPANGLVECPSCGAQFFAATDPGDIAEEARAEAEAEAARGRREAELSELRVRQVSTLRRSMIRTRGYYITGAWACIGAALELAWLAGLKFHELYVAHANGRHVSGWEFPAPVVEGACVIACALACRHSFKRAGNIERELEATVMKDPETPPDLSTLGGGVEQWRGLEQMHEQAGGESSAENTENT